MRPVLTRACLATLALWAASGCNHKADIKPAPRQLDVKEKLPIQCGLLIPESRRDEKVSQKAASYKGSLTPFELSIGTALESSSMNIFPQVFEGLQLVRTAEEAARLPCHVEPTIGKTEFKFLEDGGAVTVQATAEAHVILWKGTEKVWEKTLLSPVSSGGTYLASTDTGEKVANALGAAIGSVLEELARAMVDSATVVDFVRQARAAAPQG